MVQLFSLNGLINNLRLRKILSDLLNVVFTFKYYVTGNKPTTKIKRRFLSQHGRLFSCTVVVESGTYLGQSTKYFSKQFTKVFSVEISPKLFEFSQKRLAKLKNVLLLQGDSVDQLPKIIPFLYQPTIFYLDAHASGGVTHQGSEPSPVKKELDIIRNFRFLNRSIIALDDARGFDGSNSYPSFKEICKWAADNKLQQPYIHLDMIIIEPVTKL
jgi:hypothetical protein